MKKIENGDEVRIDWSDGSFLHGIMENLPQVTGELMIISTKDKRLIYINTASSSFKQMTRANKSRSFA